MQSGLSESSADVKAEPPLSERLWGDRLRKFPVEHHSNRKCWLDETQNIPQECANSIKTFERGQAGSPSQPTSPVSWLALPSSPGSLASPSGKGPVCSPCPLRGPLTIIKIMESYKVCRETNKRIFKWKPELFQNQLQGFTRRVGTFVAKHLKSQVSPVSSIFHKTSPSEKKVASILQQHKITNNYIQNPNFTRHL